MKVVDSNGNEIDFERMKEEYSKLTDNFIDRHFTSGIFGYRATYILPRPWMMIKEIGYRIKWAWQRVFRGWDDRVIWSVDSFLAENIPIWLGEIKKMKWGTPTSMFEDTDWDDETWGYVPGAEERAWQKYEEILNEIIEGFNAYKAIQDECVPSDSARYQQLEKDFKHGFELFGEHFGTFWT